MFLLATAVINVVVPILVIPVVLYWTHRQARQAAQSLQVRTL